MRSTECPSSLSMYLLEEAAKLWTVRMDWQRTPEGNMPLIFSRAPKLNRLVIMKY